MLAVAVLNLCLGLAYASSTPSHDPLHGEGPGKPLGKAFAKPPNVATDLDCAIKELAWDYAKSLLTNVSVHVALSLHIYNEGLYLFRETMIRRSQSMMLYS